MEDFCEKRSKSKRNTKPTTSGSMELCKMSDGETEDDIFANETIGYILSHTPPIVERILEHLPVPILNRCARVCKLWNSVVQAIKRRRRNILWMFKTHAMRQDYHVNPDDPKQTIYATSTPLHIGDHFHEILNKAYCEPKFGIMFCVEEITKKPKKYFSYYGHTDTGNKRDRKKKRLCPLVKSDDTGSANYRVPFMKFFSKNLPQQCRMISCVAPGIVGTPVDCSGSIELQNSVGFTSLFFPTIPGLEIFQFSITDTDTDAFCDIRKHHRFPLHGEDGIEYVTGIPKDKKLKCLLVFTEDLPQMPEADLTRSILEHYLQKHNFHLALGGAFVERIIAPLKLGDDSREVATGVAFAGENVNAASVVLEPSIRKPQQVLEKLTELKSCNFSEENCVAFMFACCGRGVLFYGKPNVEAETFRKIFPKVPLFGLFGNGEIGINYLPNVSTESRKSQKSSTKDQSHPHWFHGYTTVFILLSWNKK